MLNNLVLCLSIVDFSVFWPWTSPTVWKHLSISILFDPPGVLGQVVSLLWSILSLRAVQLNCYKKSEASHIYQIVTNANVSIVCALNWITRHAWIAVNVLEKSSVSEEIYLSILLSTLRPISGGLVYPLVKLYLIVNGWKKIEIGE